MFHSRRSSLRFTGLATIGAGIVGFVGIGMQLDTLAGKFQFAMMIVAFVFGAFTIATSFKEKYK